MTGNSQTPAQVAGVCAIKSCPFTTLYWDFLDRNLEEFKGNHRMAQQLFGIGRLKDMDQVRQRAAFVLAGLDKGEV